MTSNKRESNNLRIRLVDLEGIEICNGLQVIMSAGVHKVINLPQKLLPAALDRNTDELRSKLVTKAFEAGLPFSASPLLCALGRWPGSQETKNAT